MPWILFLLALAAGPSPAASWSLDPSWDDGRAEVARYDARRLVYGRERRFETVILTVKEEMDTRTGVKADPPHDGRSLVTVLKSNMLSSIPTENYTYHYMTSVFVRRDDPLSLVKLSQSSQEWCGTTYKEVVTWDGPPRLVRHSYFDGQGDDTVGFPIGRDVLPEEQLLVAVRGLRLDAGQEVALQLYDTLVTHTAPVPALRAVRARGTAPAPFETPAGTFSARRVEILDGPPAAPGTILLSLWVEEAPRAALLALEAADGRSLRLKSIERRDYWSR